MSNENLCIVCFQPLEDAPTDEEAPVPFIECPNHHQAHYHCIKQWLVDSDHCPLCHTKFDESVMALVADYKAKVEAQREEEARKKKELAEKQAAEDQATFPPALLEKFNEGRKLAYIGRLDEALDELWDLLDEHIADPKSDAAAEVNFYTGMVQYDLGQYALAITSLMNAVKVNIDNAFAFYYLGLCYDELGMKDKIKWAFERGVKKMKVFAEQDAKYAPFVQYMSKKLVA